MPFQVVPVRDRKLHGVLRRAAVTEVCAGEALWHAEDPAAECVHVHEGLVALLDPWGRARDVALPGELAALEALGEGATFVGGARALVRCRVARVEGRALMRALRRGQRTLPLMMEALVRERDRVRASAGGAGAASAEARLCVVVLDLVGRLTDPAEPLPAGLTHQLLGEIAGLHRSTVTTLLNDWLYRNLVELRGRRLRIATPDDLALGAGLGGVR
jgi:CRP-like cAMP-binding protein